MAISSEVAKKTFAKTKPADPTSNRESKNILEHSSSSSSTTTIHTYIQSYIEENTDNPKILRSYKIHKKLADSLRLFCALLEINQSEGVEWSIMDWMKAQAYRLPVHATFNLVSLPQKVKRCGCRGCKKPAVALGVYLDRNEEYALCEQHLEVAENHPRVWKVLSKEREA